MCVKNVVQFFLISITLLFWSFDAVSQTAKIDSLQRLVKALKGESRVDALNKLAFALNTINIEKSKEAAQFAHRESEKIGYKHGTAEALIAEAIAAYSVGDDSISIPLFKKSIALSNEIGDRELEGYGLAFLGVNYLNLDLLDSAFRCYSRSVTLLEPAGNTYYLSFLYLVMSDYYLRKGEPEVQYQYLVKCWEIRVQSAEQEYLPYIGKRMAAYFTSTGDYDTALSYLRKSQDALRGDTVDNEAISIIYQQRAIIYARWGNYSGALVLFSEAKHFYEANTFPLELTDLLIEIGEVFAQLSDYETSLKNYFEALRVAEKNHYEYERTKILIGLSWVYFSLEQYPPSRNFVEQAIKLSRDNHHQFEEAAAYNLMGLVMDEQNNDEQALSYFQRALELRAALKDRAGIAGTLYNMGILFEKEGNFTDALEYQLQSLEIEESLNHTIGLAYSYESLGKLYIELRNFKNAEEYLIKAEKISRKIKAGAVLADTFKDRRDLLQRQGKIAEALKYSFLYENLKDSIFNQNLTNRLTSLENTFELEQKDKEILLLHQNKLLQDTELIVQKSKLRQQWLIIAAVVTGIVMLVVIVFILYRSNRRTTFLNREINERNKVIASQNEELVQSNEEVSAQRDMVAEQNLKLKEAWAFIEEKNVEIRQRNENLEEEVEKRTQELVEYNQQLEQFAFISSHNLRAPVARILGLGQLLELPAKSDEDEKIIKDRLIATAKEMDRVVKDLNAILDIRKHNAGAATEIDMSEELGLVCISLEKEISDAQAVIKTDFAAAPTVKTIRPYMDSILYNLISNAIKYRVPDRPPIIVLQTSFQDDFICLKVCDNGLGIDLALYRNKLFTLYSRFHDHVEGKGLGLYLVKSQLSAVGGKIEVESKLYEGTTFFVYLKRDKELS